VIVHEPFWTATARHADIVLPATTPLERNDIASGEGSLMAMHRAIAPVGEARSDFDILTSIAARMGIADAFTEGRDEMAWIRHLYETTRANALAAEIELPPFDEFWRRGFVTLPKSPRPPVVFAKLRDDPESRPLATPSGKIELFSERIAGFNYDDCPGHGAWLEPAEWLGSPKAARFPIHLITNQPATRLHSQYDGGAISQASKIQGREPIRIHPDDAAPRGIATGDIVRVFNDRGAFLAGAVVSADVRRSVAQIATGAWYDPLAPGVPGTLEVHGNPNVVTRDAGTSKLAQATSALSALVEIEKFAGPAPPVRAFEPPEAVARGV
jgi:biotin/methionine sulfoxide reductase